MRSIRLARRCLLVIASIPVGDKPIGVAVSPSGRVFVSNQFDDTVSVIDRVTNAVMTTVAVGDAPLGITWTASRGSTSLVCVANSQSDTVSVTLGSATVGTVTPRPDGSFEATFAEIDCAVTSGTLTVTAGWASATTTVALSPCSTPAFAG